MVSGEYVMTLNKEQGQMLHVMGTLYLTLPSITYFPHSHLNVILFHVSEANKLDLCPQAFKAFKVEAKIACTSICKCLGCRNVEESVERLRRRDVPAAFERLIAPRPPAQHAAAHKQPCSFVTSEVIEAVCQCLIAAAMEGADGDGEGVDDRIPFAVSNGQCNTAQPSNDEGEAVRAVIEEFARCLQDIINAAQHTQSTPALGSEVNT
ncbi:Protein lin-54 homolog [Eumeta japonica]|uniref:Protein lin-54 homolog n=1 Tax=Eumeta variegata TaxID=151549 RepID=A0A4C1XY72_EUMVA|nr:Protein lin-54 homolog [Eumeta japonica]